MFPWRWKNTERPAEIPAAFAGDSAVAMKPSGPVVLSVSGRALEDGLLGSLFPGLVRESQENSISSFWLTENGRIRGFRDISGWPKQGRTCHPRESS
jgi:hypothetical protein